MIDIATSIERVKERIVNACMKSGRSADDVRLVGATKGVDIERIQLAASMGIRDFGENYIQEAKNKIESLGKDVTWHMIGHVQSNKVKYVPNLFGWVHSADRWEMLETLEKFGKEISILFELNLSGEDTKHGCSVRDLKRFLEKSSTLRYVKLKGLMTMPPYTPNPENSRPFYRQLRNILREVNSEFSLQMKELSMGMSDDFEVAIEEGATMVRIGTALFGARQ